MKNEISLDRNTVSVLVFALLALFYSYLLMGIDYFPYLSVCAVIISGASLVFVFKQPKNLTSISLYVGIIILATFLVTRVNEFLTLLDLVTIIYLISALISYYPGKKWNVVDLVLMPVMTFGRLLSAKDIFKVDFKINTSDLNVRKYSLRKIIISVLLTIVVLVMIIPLLAYANPIFGKYMENIVSLFDLTNFFEFISESLLFWRAIIFIISYFLLSKTASYLSTEAEPKTFTIENNLKNYLSLPKLAVVLILLLFFASQIEFYSISSQALLEEGYSHSEHTREVFGQLSLVALIIFALLYNSKNSKLLDKAFNYILIAEGIFLNMIGYRSVLEYIEMWGFTSKRLYGLTGVAWLFATFAIIFVYFTFGKSRTFLVKSLFSFTIFTVILINMVNFDYIMYHNGKSTTHIGIDYEYLSELSVDSEGHYDLAKTLASDTSCMDPEKNDSTWGLNSISKLESLKRKYKNNDLRVFNFSEYKAVQQVNDTEIEMLKGKLFECNEKLN